MSEDTLFREINEDLRADRMRALWRRFGPYVIGGAVAVVLLVALNEGWSWWQQSNAARSSDALYVALDAAEAGEIDAALAALETVEKQGSGKYPVLGQFAEAAYLAQKGKVTEAIVLYDTLAASLDVVRLRELALVLAAFQLVDSADIGGIETRVGGLIAANSPFAGVAREALGLAQYKAGDFDAALATFEAAEVDVTASADLLARISVYVAQLDAEGATSVATE
ncbi:MAG: tetratricopeptide repeat protein [Alphaproteobacteria bacterium]|nr:tetratricopeptide repeat protein [Alphaproteobacteria bacterium]